MAGGWRNRSDGFRWWSVFKCELQRAALTFQLVKLGLPSSSARNVVWDMEDDLQQIWGGAISNRYKAYAIVIPNKQKKRLVFWCWKASAEKIDPSAQDHIILPVSEILARVADQAKQRTTALKRLAFAASRVNSCDEVTAVPTLPSLVTPVACDVCKVLGSIGAY